MQGLQASAKNDARHAQDAAGVLRSLQERGVDLWLASGQLRYRAPKGSLSPGDIERLRAAREQIIDLLEARNDADWAAETDPPDRAPLAFSQQAHCDFYRLAERKTERTVTCATRICGKLRVDLLRESIRHLVARHGALRTRIGFRRRELIQEISPSLSFSLEMRDLTRLPAAAGDAEVVRQIHEMILEPVDVTSGPLWGFRLLALRKDEHVLIVAMEHSIADGFSLNVFLREMFASYIQLSKGRAIQLPPLQLQFADYARWQARTHSTWMERHASYWQNRIAGVARTRFPEDRKVAAGNPGRGTLTIHIKQPLAAELRESCRRQKTTVVMGLFAAYAGLVLRWCNVRDAVFQYQIDGRSSPAIENTIGYFASVLFLRVNLTERDAFGDLFGKVTQEYCDAYEHADAGYIAASRPDAGFMQNTRFNWIPLGSPDLDLTELDGTEDALSASPFHFVYPASRTFDAEADREPFVLVSDRDNGEIAVDVYYSLRRFSPRLMDRFGRNLLVFVECAARSPEAPVMQVPLVR